MTWTVLLGREFHEDGYVILEEFAEIVEASEYGSESALDADIDRFDAIIVGALKLPRDRIAKASNLKVIASQGVGLDPVDITAATEHGVLVCNNLGANTRAVAEYTIASMLTIRRNLIKANADLRSGTWDKFGYMGPEIEGQVMGVLGYGAIGRLVLNLASGLGMKGAAYDPYIAEADFPDDVERVPTNGNLFELSDVVSIHVPLTDETRNLVTTKELHALGDDGIVINAARGGIINENDLFEVLQNDEIAGAAIDVFEKEPAPTDHPFFELENVLVTPHIAGSTNISVPAKDTGSARNVEMVYEGSIPPTTVNRDAICLWMAHGGEISTKKLRSDPF